MIGGWSKISLPSIWVLGKLEFLQLLAQVNGFLARLYELFREVNCHREANTRFLALNSPRPFTAKMDAAWCVSSKFPLSLSSTPPSCTSRRKTEMMCLHSLTKMIRWAQYKTNDRFFISLFVFQGIVPLPRCSCRSVLATAFTSASQQRSYLDDVVAATAYPVGGDD